jgi:hypothetical protein
MSSKATLQQEIPTKGAVYAVTFSKDGTRLAYGGGWWYGDGYIGLLEDQACDPNRPPRASRLRFAAKVAPPPRVARPDERQAVIKLITPRSGSRQKQKLSQRDSVDNSGGR